MNNHNCLKKLKEFKKYVKSFINSRKNGHKDIHILRILSRELYSLLSDADPFYERVKKVIKISNKIRDTDVFFKLFLPSLPKKYRNKLEIERIEKYTNKGRKKKIEKLHKYLKSLDIGGDILLHVKADESVISAKKEPNFDQIELHQYRIYIKKMLYREKNSLPINTKRVNILSKIKDCLGSINDNHNGYERCKACDIKAPLLKRIAAFTQAKNLKLFQKFQVLNRKYIGGVA